MVTASRHNINYSWKPLNNNPFKEKFDIWRDPLFTERQPCKAHRSDEPRLELVWQRPPPRVETLVQVVARQVSHAAHVEIRKPKNRKMLNYIW